MAKIGRTIGRALSLNEDLIEAIALGHDIGHPPYGHFGGRSASPLFARFIISARFVMTCRACSFSIR
ncbi:HD domain-containing protein [Methanogenium cariaci]|uniref:HD domain-containing protein n=1 Tax=Methanogenium cariaci TaxID=2197 RepID=UPI001FE218DF|nr:HD domain-containing protein [Methanogenium cariaci]